MDPACGDCRISGWEWLACTRQAGHRGSLGMASAVVGLHRSSVSGLPATSGGRTAGSRQSAQSGGSTWRPGLNRRLSVEKAILVPVCAGEGEAAVTIGARSDQQ